MTNSQSHLAVESSDTFQLIRGGSEGSPVLFIAGPPFSARMWEHVQRRLGARRSVAVSIPGHGTVGGLDGARIAIEQLIEREGIEVVVAHGFALSALMRLEGASLRLKVALNGPLGEPSAQLSSLIKRLFTGASAKLLLRPSLLVPILASSAGLRRAVKNPYVMEREVVEELLQEGLSSAEFRREVAGLIAAASAPPGPGETPLVLLWGSDDRLHPQEEIAAWMAAHPSHEVELDLVPGGRWLFPVERPWEVADRLIERMRNLEIA